MRMQRYESYWKECKKRMSFCHFCWPDVHASHIHYTFSLSLSVSLSFFLSLSLSLSHFLLSISQIKHICVLLQPPLDFPLNKMSQSVFVNRRNRCRHRWAEPVMISDNFHRPRIHFGVTETVELALVSSIHGCLECQCPFVATFFFKRLIEPNSIMSDWS